MVASRTNELDCFLIIRADESGRKRPAIFPRLCKTLRDLILDVARVLFPIITNDPILGCRLSGLPKELERSLHSQYLRVVFLVIYDTDSTVTSLPEIGCCQPAAGAVVHHDGVELMAGIEVVDQHDRDARQLNIPQQIQVHRIPTIVRWLEDNAINFPIP